MFTIKRAADLAGVTVDTLRAWERRYAVVTPSRTAAGYRLYDADQVATLASMQGLIQAGWSAREAAGEVSRTRPDPTRTAQVLPHDQSADPARAGTTDATTHSVTHPAARPTSDPTCHATASIDLSMADWAGLTAAFVDAARRMEAERLADVLDEGFGRNTFEVVVDDWLMPTVAELGSAWSRGRVAEAAEHLASHAVLRRLAAVYEASARKASGPRVVVGLPSGCHHELGVFAFGCAARRQGLNVLYVGADLPTRSWLEAVLRHDADAAVLAAPDRVAAGVATQTIAHLRAERPQLDVLVGGREQDRVRDARPLGHRIGPAAEDLAQHLASTSPRPQSLRPQNEPQHEPQHEPQDEPQNEPHDEPEHEPQDEPRARTREQRGDGC